MTDLTHVEAHPTQTILPSPSSTACKVLEHDYTAAAYLLQEPECDQYSRNRYTSFGNRPRHRLRHQASSGVYEALSGLYGFVDRLISRRTRLLGADLDESAAGPAAVSETDRL